MKSVFLAPLSGQPVFVSNFFFFSYKKSIEESLPEASASPSIMSVKSPLSGGRSSRKTLISRLCPSWAQNGEGPGLLMPGGHICYIQPCQLNHFYHTSLFAAKCPSSGIFPRDKETFTFFFSFNFKDNPPAWTKVFFFCLFFLVF